MSKTLTLGDVIKDHIGETPIPENISEREEAISKMVSDWCDAIVPQVGKIAERTGLSVEVLDELLPTAIRTHVVKCFNDAMGVPANNGILDIIPSQETIKQINDAAEKFAETGQAIIDAGYTGGMALTELLLNSEHSLKDELAFINETEVVAVTLDSITALDGTEVEFGTVGGKRFVPSFDSKEDGKWIIHYFVKDIDDKVILKLIASYDHNTKVVKAHGEYWERCAIRIDLK